MMIVGKQRLVPGILGGLSPLAHVEFERRLIATAKERGACLDQDHPVWIVVSGSDTPDRTQSLAGQAADCTPWLIRYGQLLERAQADFLIVTCNTAHAFYHRVQPHLTIPWIHLMHCTAHQIAERHNVQRVGILATDGSLQTGLYSRSLAEIGLIPIAPPIASPIQTQIMQSIYHPHWGIKASGGEITPQTLEYLYQAMDWLQQQGAELVVIGCTEISAAMLHLTNLPLPWIDPLDVAAMMTLDLAFGNRTLPAVVAA